MSDARDGAARTGPGGGRAVRAEGVVRLAVPALVAATLAIAAAYASAFGAGGAPRWAAWAMAVGVPVALVAVMTLGAARAGRLPLPLFAAFLFVGALLVAGFALALALPADLGAAEPLLLGLPRRAAIVVYGIGLLPTLVLPVAYALTFEQQTLRAEDLARVVALARERGAGSGESGADDGAGSAVGELGSTADDPRILDPRSRTSAAPRSPLPAPDASTEPAR